jgi:hypothetical protein
VLKKVVIAFTPPIVVEIIQGLLNRIFPSPLFEGDDTLFKSVLSKTEYYGEYGCGATTMWVLANTNPM